MRVAARCALARASVLIFISLSWIAGIYIRGQNYFDRFDILSIEVEAKSIVGVSLGVPKEPREWGMVRFPVSEGKIVFNRTKYDRDKIGNWVSVNILSLFKAGLVYSDASRKVCYATGKQSFINEFMSPERADFPLKFFDLVNDLRIGHIDKSSSCNENSLSWRIAAISTSHVERKKNMAVKPTQSNCVHGCISIYLWTMRRFEIISSKIDRSTSQPTLLYAGFGKSNCKSSDKDSCDGRHKPIVSVDLPGDPEKDEWSTVSSQIPFA